MSVAAIFGFIGAIVIIAIVMRNSLIGKKNQVENAFSGIDVQLKKRYDLIPNLVSSVKQYMEHEKHLLTEITELRAKAMSGDLSSDEKVAIDNQISHKLSGINVAVENYPDLKSHTSFQSLNHSLNEVEGQLSAARRAFNSSVTDYNDAIEMFPSSIIAGLMKLTRKQVFETPEVERQNVNVKNLFNA